MNFALAAVIGILHSVRIAEAVLDSNLQVVDLRDLTGNLPLNVDSTTQILWQTQDWEHGSFGNPSWPAGGGDSVGYPTVVKNSHGLNPDGKYYLYYAHHDPLSGIGCTSTYTLGVQRRIDVAGELGADAVQVALPYWMEIADDRIVPFFKEIGKALGDMALSVYETARAKVTLTLEQHQAVKETVPNYLMVKANADTLGYTPEGCEALSQFVNVFVGEHTWDELGPKGAVGCCSAFIYYNPKVFLEVNEQLKRKDWDALKKSSVKIKGLLDFMAQHCDPQGFTDTAYDRLGGAGAGFLKMGLASRGPYKAATEEDVKALRQWYAAHFPEMLDI